MFVLTGGNWTDGYLDEHRDPGTCRVQVSAWLRLRRIDDLYFVPGRDWRRVSNYVREIGTRQVWRKIRSRLAERGRNEKVLAVGAGRIVEPGAGQTLAAGTPVLFVAPCHPVAIERIVLPPGLVRAIQNDAWRRLVDAGGVLLHDDAPDLDAQIGPLALEGWHRLSGLPLDVGAAQAALARLDGLGGTIASRAWTRLALPSPSPVSERTPPIAAAGGAPLRAALFGLGHYAKTVVIPNLDPRLRLEAVHEIDPLQAGPHAGREFRLDTAPEPRPDERYDVYCITGYHHTHAPLAAHAIALGASAIVEKPLVTTREQLDTLGAAVRQGPGRVYACFHKRYSHLTALAREDLATAPGQPISYHCVVYEVPLPVHHWYRWPVSRTRLIANGCHWLDHFLFLNDFTPVRRADAWRAGNGDAICAVELENGAVFSMALTDHGSGRIGVRNHVELRAGRITVCITDDTHYVAEDERAIRRRTRVNKMQAFARMYRQVSAAIVDGRPLDTAETVLVSAGLALDLDDAYVAQGGGMRAADSTVPSRMPMLS